MRTPEWFMSALELILAYLRQRARLRLFAPLSIVLALAGRWMVASSSATISAMTLAALEALGLTLAFRIWDDLEDREADRVRHPARVMANASTTPFYVLGFALSSASVFSLVAASSAVARLATLSIAAALLSIWYRTRPQHGHHALAEHVLALKYPLIAYAVAPELPSQGVTLRVAVVLVVLYVPICVSAYADDAELRQSLMSRRSVT
jgi:4-hydroxybenzoate polyprenyltransferase